MVADLSDVPAASVDWIVLQTQLLKDLCLN